MGSGLSALRDRVEEALAAVDRATPAQWLDVVDDFAAAACDQPDGTDSHDDALLIDRCAIALFIGGRIEPAYRCASFNFTRVQSSPQAPAELLAPLGRTLGMMATEIGDGIQSLEVLSATLKLAHEAGLAEHQVRVWNTLGILFICHGDLPEAQRCFEEAGRLFDREGVTPGDQVAVCTNLIYVHCCLGQPEQAMQYAAACLTKVADRSALPGIWGVMRSVAFWLAYLQLALRLGWRAEAQRALTQARQVAVQGRGVPDVDGRLLQCEALEQIFHGCAETGVQLLRRALETHSASVRLREQAFQIGTWALETIHRLDLAADLLEVAAREKQCDRQRSFALRLAGVAHWRQFAADVDRSVHVILTDQTSSQRKLQEVHRQHIEHEYLERLSITAELRDDNTGGHAQRVGEMAARLARELGMPRGFCEDLRHAARLHDIGKVGIPDAILLKPGRLTEQEREIMNRHCEIGAQLLSNSKLDVVRMAMRVALHHHEHWSGGGYPFGLGGEGIPLEARITAVVDVFDALTHERPYKKAWTVEASIDEIVRLVGQQFDPVVAHAFVDMVVHRPHTILCDGLQQIPLPASHDPEPGAWLSGSRRLLRQVAMPARVVSPAIQGHQLRAG